MCYFKKFHFDPSIVCYIVLPDIHHILSSRWCISGTFSVLRQLSNIDFKCDLTDKTIGVHFDLCRHTVDNR